MGIDAMKYIEVNVWQFMGNLCTFTICFDNTGNDSQAAF